MKVSGHPWGGNIRKARGGKVQGGEETQMLSIVQKDQFRGKKEREKK